MVRKDRYTAYNINMWTCSKCGRIFQKTNQPHSCQTVPIESHFANKPQAREIFYSLLAKIDQKIGKCKVISLPCCLHLYGQYDFLAALPMKDGLEIRIASDRKIISPRLKISVPLSSQKVKNCFEISSASDIDAELMAWVEEAYLLYSSHDQKSPN